MEFDKTKLYTKYDCDEIEIGSKGLFLDSVVMIIDLISKHDNLDEWCDSLSKIDTFEKNGYVFINDNNSRYRFFYLVKLPRKRPCTLDEIIDWWDNSNDTRIYIVNDDEQVIFRGNLEIDTRYNDTPFYADTFMNLDRLLKYGRKLDGSKFEVED